MKTDSQKTRMYALAARIEKVLFREILSVAKAITKAVTEIDSIAHELGQIEKDLKKGEKDAA